MAYMSTYMFGLLCLWLLPKSKENYKLDYDGFERRQQ